MSLICAILLLPSSLWAAEDPRVAAFLSRAEQYAKIRNSATQKAPILPKTATPEQIQNHERALVAEIRAARPNAKQGDIFTPEIQPVLIKILKDNLGGAAHKESRAATRTGNPAYDKETAETAPPVIRVGEDVLVAGSLAASNDPEARDQHPVGEGAEIRPGVTVGDGALRFGSRSSESAVRVGFPIPCPRVLRHGERHVLLPVVAGQAPDADAVRSSRLTRQRRRHENILDFEIELEGRPGATVVRQSR